jgi:hypothetical protein
MRLIAVHFVPDTILAEQRREQRRRQQRHRVAYLRRGVDALGGVVFSAPASQTPSGAQQPALPMLMTLQSEDLQGGAGAASGTQTMSVDWVEQFSWNG